MHARCESSWECRYGLLHKMLSIVCSLPRIRSSTYGEFTEAVSKPSDLPDQFTDLFGKLDPEIRGSAYRVIEEQIVQAQKYVTTWLQYQSLWDMDMNSITNRMGDDLIKWQDLLNSVKKSRVTFDNSYTYKAFGPVTINYDQVQVGP